MLLDEPTASMDGVLEARVMQHLFKEIAQDSVLVVVTHKPALLPHVQRIIVLDRGQIVIDGPRDAVLARLRQGGAPPPTSGGPAGAVSPASSSTPPASSGSQVLAGGPAFAVSTGRSS
jgi:ATP-binding cassette subfamily C protein LapB